MGSVCEYHYKRLSQLAYYKKPRIKECRLNIIRGDTLNFEDVRFASRLILLLVFKPSTAKIAPISLNKR